MSTAPKKTYFDMVKEAIIALKDRTGSSSQAIKAYIVANNKDLDFQQVSSNITAFQHLLTSLVHPLY